jgi:hypothetical protein
VSREDVGSNSLRKSQKTRRRRSWRKKRMKEGRGREEVKE